MKEVWLQIFQTIKKLARNIGGLALTIGILIIGLATTFLPDPVSSANSNPYFLAAQNNITVYDNSTGKLVPMGMLKEGQIYKKIRDLGNWYEINIWGKKGYVWKAATRPATGNSINNWASNLSSNSGATAIDPLTVYDNTSGNLVPFGKIHKGVTFNYVRQEGRWLVVVFGGRKGYVYEPATKKLFRPDDHYFEVLQNNVTVYDNSTGKLVPIGKLTKGQTYKRNRSIGNWHEIEIWDKKGYVWKDATRPTSGNPVKNWVGNLASKNTATAIEHLTVYDNTSGKLVPFGMINQGTSFQYVSQSGRWLIVEFGGRKGYVYEPATKKPFKSSDQYFEVLQDNVTVYNKGNKVKLGKLTKNQTYKRVRDVGNWHEINMAGVIGYVWKAATRPVTKNSNVLWDENFSAKNPTKANSDLIVYQDASSKSPKIGSIYRGTSFNYISKNGNWLKINLGGRIGYVMFSAKNESVEYKKYDHSLVYMVDMQMMAGPKADGAGKISATPAQVAYYVNPNNFGKGTAEFFQFLVLSKPAGLSAEEINVKILKGKGKLNGMGQAFVDAANEHNINEIYLIAHALHETGNGESTLAKGVPVDGNGNITRDRNGNIAVTDNTVRTVYNVYGWGAKDANPLESGAKAAFQKRWFTINDAIVKGAKLIGSDYIHKGQNTLYKMRWNPDNPGEHQYATHVAWAVSQAKNMYNFYQLLSNYEIAFEVPQYAGSYEYYREFPAGVVGKTTVNLNLRNGPSTNAGILLTIQAGTKINILATNGSWYKVNYGGKIGWVSIGENGKSYVNLLNLLQIKADTLNVRTTPNTNKNPVGQLHMPEYVTGVLDKNDNLLTSNGWYQIFYSNQHYPGPTAWISGSYVRVVK